MQQSHGLFAIAKLLVLAGLVILVYTLVDSRLYSILSLFVRITIPAYASDSVFYLVHFVVHATLQSNLIASVSLKHHIRLSQQVFHLT